MNLSYQ